MLKNDLLLNHKRYLYPLAGGTLTVFLWLVLSMTNSIAHFELNRYSEIMVSCLFAGGVFAGSSFQDLNSNKGTCNYLLLPASIFEKYLVQFIIRFVIFIPVALGLFWVVAHFAEISARAFNYMRDKEILIDSFDYSILYKDHAKTDLVIMGFSVFSLGTFAFAARLFFKRFAVVKTIFLGTFCLFALLTGMVILSHIFNPAETQGFEVELKDFVLGKDMSSMKLFICYIACLSWLFFLPLGYFLLKEKQA